MTGDPKLDLLLTNLNAASAALWAAVRFEFQMLATAVPDVDALVPAVQAASDALAAYTVAIPLPPPPPVLGVTTTVSGLVVMFKMTGIPATVKNVSITEGAKKIADVAPAGFPKTVTTTAGTHTYTVVGWPTLPGGGGSPVFSLSVKATV